MTEALLNAVVEATRAAGDHALCLLAGGYEQWEKTPGNPVSEVDLAVNRMLHQALAQIDPEAGWLSEETADSAERLLKTRVWVVDPIDGTRDLIRGRPGWAISVALIEAGRPLLGVLDAPARGEIWTALAGKGAHRNGEAILASGATSLSGARVPADALPRDDSDLVTVHKPNSIALRMAMVAADEADLAASFRWGHEWDIAAAALIVEEAGGIVSDARGHRLRFNSTKGQAFGVLAAGAAIHGAALERLSARAASAFAR